MTRAIMPAEMLEAGRRLQSSGRLVEAENIYRDVLRQFPHNAEGLHLLGVVSHQLGRNEESIDLIRSSLALAPGYAPAWQNLILPLIALGRVNEAVEAGAEAIRLDPKRIGARHNHTLALVATGDWEKAARAAEAALALDPNDVGSWTQLGHIRMSQKDPQLSVQLLQRALLIDPDHEEALYNHGVALQELRREAEAAESYRKVLLRNPAHRGARLNLGVALRSQGLVPQALAVWAESVEKPEEWPQLAYNIACAHLLAGDWGRAWAGYEERFSATDPIPDPPKSGAPRWDGTAMPDATLLVHHEQGLGDTIQFVRLLELAAAQVGHLVFVCQPHLHGLLSSLALFQKAADGTRRATLLRHGEEPPPHRAWSPLLSLAGLLGLDRATMPRRAPYLAPRADLVKQWSSRLSAGEQAPRPFRIGLVWQGNPNAPVEKGRSVPLRHLEPLTKMAGVRLISLQKGAGREQLAASGLPIEDLGEEFDAGPDAFLDTAAVLAALDLVITSDTSMAHVAGALGRPVWLMLKHVPDWRWGLGGELSPWYPSMRLFRQREPDGWDAVVAEVGAALESLLGVLRSGTPLPADVPDPMEVALAHHQAGRYGEAVAPYRQAIARDPGNTRALNHLGMALFDATGRSASAVTAALPAVLRSTELAPDNADYFANLAVVLKQAGRVADARVALGHALAIDPRHRPARLNLVNLELAAEDVPAALAAATLLVSQHPASAAAFAAYANAAKAAKRLPEAEAAIRRAMVLAPDDAIHAVVLGTILSEAGNAAGARMAWETALAVNPNNADAYSNLGVNERNHGETGIALWFYRQAVRLDPCHADAWCNYGIAAGDMDLTAEASAAFRQSAIARPGYPDARMALGMTLLSEGRFEEGLPEYECRLQSSKLGYGAGPRAIKPWLGGSPKGLSLLIIAEQGFGDSIQFVRYAALLKEAGAARVAIGCRSRLKALLSTAEGVDDVIVEGQTLPAFDGYVQMLSLPLRLGTTLATIPASPSYLKADPDRITRWASHLAKADRGGDGFRVGIVWQGNPDPQVDRGRSIPLVELAPLGAIPGVRLIALQKGPGSEQVEAAAGILDVETLGDDFDSGPDSFLDTAAVMMNLDLVITTDTAAAHLAGALGRPTWLLLKATPEWRWLRERCDSPWYESLRLFRQDALEIEDGGSPWQAVVARLAAELARLVAGDRSRLFDRTPPVLPVRPTLSAVQRLERGLQHHHAGRFAPARADYAAALTLAPDNADVLHMLGAMALQELAFPRALLFLREAARRGLATPEFRTNLAVAWRNLNRPDEAERLVRSVIAETGSAEAHITLGNLLRDRDDLAASAAAMAAALAVKPDEAKAHRGLGNALKDLGRLDEALVAFESAMALTPNDSELRLDRAHARLAAGDLPGGFADYEARWRAAEMQPRQFEAPVWKGDRQPAARLLVHGEQGLGDHIQFMRFVRAAAARVGTLILEVRRPLFGLFRTLDLDGAALQLVEQGTDVPAHDIQIALLSLPLALGIDLAALPGAIPYLTADPARVAQWQTRLGLGQGQPDGRPLTIGLVWQGNPVARADKGRSPPLQALKPIFEVTGLRFIALQKEHGLEQLAATPFASRIERPGAGFDEGPDAFLDTAALMMGVDVIVTSDTAAAHLAGALGRPTCLMLKYAADWRWMAGRADSPWYPTMQLFRQPAPGDWDAVAKAVGQALAAKAGRS